MKLNSSLLIIFAVVCLSHTNARHKLGGGKIHQRSKRTIGVVGDIINWKLNLLQSIFGGIFGSPKKPSSNYGAPRPSYGGGRPARPRPRPQRPRPVPARPPARPSRPSYSRPARPGRPVRPPRPQTGRPNYGGGGGRPPARPATTQFGPSNAIKMLPAPNLAGLGPPPQVSSVKNGENKCWRPASA